MLAKGDLDSHASLAVRLRRAEKRILENVVSYSALQKATAAERWQQSLTEVRNDGDDTDIASGSRPFHVGSSSTVAGEQEFVRVDDGTQVYGTDAERAERDAEFFESVRRGDYHNMRCQSGDRRTGDDENQTVPVESAVERDFMSLDIRTSVESGCTPTDFPASATESDDTDLDKSLAGVSVSGQ